MELLVSEIVTNAVVHTASRRFVVQLDVASCVVVAVHDSDPTRQRPRQARLWDGGGRGLALVEELSDAWGTRGVEDGKWVWFRVG